MKALENIIMVGSFFIAAVFMTVACSDEEYISDEPDLPVSSVSELTVLKPLAGEHTFSFSFTGNVAQQLLFSTPTEWQIELIEPDGTADMSWITLFDRAGSGGDSLVVWVAAAQNETYDARRATFYLKSGDKTEEFEIYQSQLNAVLITDPKAFQNLSADEHVMPLAFDTNAGEATVSIDGSSSSWISIEPETRAMERDTVWLRIKANDGYSVRNGKVTVTSNSDKNATADLLVFQVGQAKPVIVVNNKDAFENVSNAGADIPLDMSLENVADIEQLTVEIPSPDRSWLSWDYDEDGTGIVLSVKPNEVGSRSAVVSVCAKADHSICDEIEISQESADGITVTITNKDDLRNQLPDEGSTFAVKFNSLVEEVDGSVTDENGEKVDWIRINNLLTNQAIVTCDPNLEMIARKAVIKLYPKGDNAHYDMVTVEQAPATTLLVVGSLKETIQKIIEQGIYDNWASVTSLELSGQLSDDDWRLLKDMCTPNKGYNLQTLDLTQITNTTMPDKAFNNCDLLKRITFPANLEYVPADVANGCDELIFVDIPSAVYIDHNAFDNCKKMAELWLPKNLQYLYGYAFGNIKESLKNIYLRSLPVQCESVVNNSGTPRNFSGPFKDSQQKKATLHVPADYVNYYRDPDPQHCVSLYLQDLLDGMSATSSEWIEDTPEADYKIKGKLKDKFKWADPSTVIMGDVILD